MLDMVISPRPFFERAARGDRLDTPFAILAFVGAVQAFFGAVRSWDSSPLEQVGAVMVASFIMPFLRTALLAALLHPFDLLLKPGRHFRRTYRAASWSAIFTLLSVVPMVGPALSAISQLVYGVLGIRALHPTARWVAVVLGFLALTFCFVGFYKVFQTTR
jgi:hypothetical protein